MAKKVKKKAQKRRTTKSKASGKKKTAKKKSARSPARKSPAKKKAARKKKVSRKRIRKPKLDPRIAAAMKQYEEAVQHFNRRSFRKALSLFEKVAAGVSHGLTERARVHITMCEQRIQAENSVRFRSVEEHYNYAVSQINASNFDEARAHLKKALKMDPKADHVYYALATVAALSGALEDAMGHLEQAIALRAENRFQARNDEDFEALQDDLTFQQLVFPERFPSLPGN
jgi:tetratricopeptide (TPR) repeat protein